MVELQYPSLEYNWLPTSFLKGVTIPRTIVLEDSEGFGGCYWKPQPESYMVEGKFINFARGVIGVCHKTGNDGSTLAHELRHHWQYLNDWENDNYTPWHYLHGDYEDRIVYYFTTNATEMDALMFERKVQSTPLTDYWWDLIMRYVCQ